MIGRLALSFRTEQEKVQGVVKRSKQRNLKNRSLYIIHYIITRGLFPTHISFYQNSIEFCHVVSVHPRLCSGHCKVESPAGDSPDRPMKVPSRRLTPQPDFEVGS